MEDFEFKPITEGLGFHKKQVSLKEETKKAQDHIVRTTNLVLEKNDLQKIRQPETVKSVRDLISSFPALDGLDFIEEESKQKIQVKEPLPRKDVGLAQLQPEQVLRSVDPELKVNPEVFNRKIDVVDVKPLVAAKIETAPVATTTAIPEKKLSEKKMVMTLEDKNPSLGAYLIDAFTIIGLTNVFMAALLFVTEVDVVYVLSHPATDIFTKISVGVVCISVSFFYLVIARTFFNKTLGEWTSDTQMGTNLQTASMSYPLRVTFRAFVTIITGIVVLPLLSLLMKKDIVGSICGLKLQKKVETWQ